MKTIFSRIFCTVLMLFALIGTWGTANAQDPFVQIDELESRLNKKLKLQNMTLNSIIKMYSNREPEAFGKLEEYIAKKPDAPDIGKAKKLQAEWNAKKQTELIIHHKTHAGGKWTYYAFAASDDLEKLLKDIADLHWKVNDMIDMYSKARNDANAYIRMRNAKRANELINKAKLILSESNKQRQNTNKLFEQLLSSSHNPLDTAVLDGRGLWLRGVTSEVLLFVVEVVENGKYVRAWTTRAKGGMEVTLDGRNVVIK